jgi:hypothetical protein
MCESGERGVDIMELAAFCRLHNGSNRLAPADFGWEKFLTGLIRYTRASITLSSG